MSTQKHKYRDGYVTHAKGHPWRCSHRCRHLEWSRWGKRIRPECRLYGECIRTYAPVRDEANIRRPDICVKEWGPASAMKDDPAVWDRQDGILRIRESSYEA